MNKAGILLLASAGALLLAATVALGRDVGSFGTWVWLVVLATLVGGILVAVAAWQAGPISSRRLWVAGVLGLGLLMRLVLFSSDRILSDDLYRYHWDGQVLLSGTNPYLHPPNDPSLAHLSTLPIYREINKPEVVTVYPPMAQGLFALATALGPDSLWGFRILFLISEGVAMGLLLCLLRKRGQGYANMLLMAWSPLLILQGTLPGHVDLLGLPWLVGGLYALLERRPGLAGCLWAAACLVKPLPVIFLPAVALHLGLRASLRFAVAFFVAAVLAYLPFLGAGWKLFSSMWLMASRWSFNGALAGIYESCFSPMAARFAASGTLLLLIGCSLRLGKDLTSRCLMAMAAFALCTTTLFPWYLAWMFPLLVLKPDPALLALAALVGLSDLVVIGHRGLGEWRLPAWVPWAEFLPFAGLLVVSKVRGLGMFGPDALAVSVAKYHEGRPGP